ncbi:peptide ABC transporter substrate-binding protein, partial [Lactiplantibacillus plantarum]
NAKIRQAISLSINRKTLVKNVIGAASTVSKTFVPQDLVKDAKTDKDFADESTVKNSTSYNKALAQKLWKQGLKETGIKKLSIQLLASNDEPNKPISQYLKSALEKNLDGLTVNLSNIPSKVASSRAQSGDFDLYLSGWGADFNDPISHLQIMTNNSGYNYGKYNSSTYNALVNKAQNQDANDTSARWQDMINAEKTIMKDQGITPLYQTVYSYLQNPKVKGIIHNTAGTQWNYKYAYIAK